MRFGQYENIIASKGGGGEWGCSQDLCSITKGVQYPHEGRVERDGIAIVSLVEEYEPLDLLDINIGADLVVGGHVLVWYGCYLDTEVVDLLRCWDPVERERVGLPRGH